MQTFDIEVHCVEDNKYVSIPVNSTDTLYELRSRVLIVLDLEDENVYVKLDGEIIGNDMQLSKTDITPSSTITVNINKRGRARCVMKDLRLVYEKIGHEILDRVTPETLQVLVDAGIPVARDGFMIYQKCIRCNLVEHMRIMADKIENLNCEDFVGNSPLMVAIKHGNCDIAKILMDNGANVNHQNYHGITPLISAIKRDDLEMVKLLIDYGVDVNMCSKFSISPLHWVCYGQYEECVSSEDEKTEDVRDKDVEIIKLLVNKGADVSHKTVVGSTPYMVAKWFNFTAGMNALDALGVATDVIHDDCEHKVNFNRLEFDLIKNARHTTENVEMYVGAEFNGSTKISSVDPDLVINWDKIGEDVWKGPGVNDMMVILRHKNACIHAVQSGKEYMLYGHYGYHTNLPSMSITSNNGQCGSYDEPPYPDINIRNYMTSKDVASVFYDSIEKWSRKN